MVQINRGSIVANCTELLDLKQPIQNAQNFIQPVIEVGPKISNIAVNNSNSVTGSFTLLTTATDKDFYLTYAGLAFTKNATSDNVVASMSVTIGGATRQILAIPTQTLTAGSFNQVLNFSAPLKLDRGSTISVAGAFTAGALTKYGFAGGYYLE